jgi:transketolase
MGETLGTDLSNEELKELSKVLRQDIVTMIRTAGSGHPGGSLSVVEILVELFFRRLLIDPERPDWPDRDIFILSKGHACPALYAVMARRGFFPKEELLTLRQPGSRLQGHPDARRLPGLELSAGSLGQGLGVASGLALGLRLEEAREPWKVRTGRRVYCLLGDGELQEGSVWESAMSAAHFGLANLTAIVDRNMVQLDGPTEEIMSLEPLSKKWASFNWNVVDVADGHDLEQLALAFEECEAPPPDGPGDRPTVVIARTVKGKGVSFMEGDAGWHGRCPDEESFRQALLEIEDSGGEG